MSWGGSAATRRGRSPHHARAAFLAATLAIIALACGGGAKPNADPKTASTSPDKPPPGFPSKHDQGWCDPMPDLGNSCASELKECMIVCDYISDTCALLVCMGGAWDYVERGEGAAEEEP